MCLGPLSRSIYTYPFPTLGPTSELQFEAWPPKDAESVRACEALRKFLPLACAYLERCRDDDRDDDVLEFLMGRKDTLPAGLAPPDPAIPIDVKDILERRLRTDRPGLPKKGEHGESTIARLRALAAWLPGAGELTQRGETWGVPRSFDAERDVALSRDDRFRADPRFDAFTDDETEALVTCEGLEKFVLRAYAYLKTCGNDGRDDDVLEFLMGRKDTLPEGLAPPDPAFPIDVQDILELRLRTDRPRLPKKGEHGETTTELLGAFAAWLRDVRELTERYKIRVDPRFDAFTDEETEAVVTCRGLETFMPLVCAHLETCGNDGHDDDVHWFLMGLKDTLPEGLAPPDPAIPIDVQDILERRLRTDRPRLPKKGEHGETTTELLGAFAAWLRGARELRARRKTRGVPQPFDGETHVPWRHKARFRAEPQTFEARFDALTLHETQAVLTCEGLREFVPRACAHLAKGDDAGLSDAGLSDDVAKWLAGPPSEGPTDLAPPDPAIPPTVKAILARLLCVAPIDSGTPHPPEKTIDQLRALAARLQGPSQRPMLEMEEGVARRHDAGASSDTSAFQQRLGDLTVEQWAQLSRCDALWDFLPPAKDFLAKPEHRHHSEAVAHYLMGIVDTLPDGLLPPKPAISSDVKKLLRQLLRTHEYKVFVWKRESAQKTYQKLDELTDFRLFDQLGGGRASVRV